MMKKIFKYKKCIKGRNSFVIYPASEYSNDKLIVEYIGGFRELLVFSPLVDNCGNSFAIKVDDFEQLLKRLKNNYKESWVIL